MTDYQGWGTGLLCAGDSFLLIDSPVVVTRAVMNAEDDGFLSFTLAAGYEDDDRFTPEKWVPRRPTLFRADQVDVIEPVSPEYLAYHERESD